MATSLGTNAVAVSRFHCIKEGWTHLIDLPPFLLGGDIRSLHVCFPADQVSPPPTPPTPPPPP